MKFNLKALLGDNFIRGTFILTFVTLFSAALNYLVHPLLTRQLSVSEYGDYQTLLSFMTILSIATVVVTTTLTKEFSVLSETTPEEIKFLRHKAASYLSYFGLAVFVFILLSIGYLNKFFKLSSPATLVVVSLILIYGFPLAVNKALLTGRKYFSALSLNNFIDAASRLVLVIIFVIFLPWGLIGASLALGLSGFLSFLISFKQIRKIALPEKKIVFSGEYKKIRRYGFLVLCFTALAQFFYNFDMFSVKFFFNPEEAGLYGAMLTIGRIIFFIGSSVPLVMFPAVAALKDCSDFRKYRILGKSLGLMSILAIPTALFIAVFPEFSVRMVVGVKYLSIVPYLPTLTLVFFLLTLLTVLAQYFLALAKRRSLLVLFFAAALEIILISVFHDNIWQIINSLGIVFGTASFVLLVLFFSDYLSFRRKRFFLV
ncbi:MAG: oligosaccharide flippase family protein [Patescibacteria group bacterium]|jgi:O-antigen/teichoic acid export membrane protein